jgi:hypothetical protein
VRAVCSHCHADLLIIDRTEIPVASSARHHRKRA